MHDMNYVFVVNAARRECKTNVLETLRQDDNIRSLLLSKER